MTRADLLTELARLEQLFADCTIITRIILNPDGTEVRRISRVVLNKPVPTKKETSK